MQYEGLVPQRFDLFSFILFLGVIQGFLFAYFLLKKRSAVNLPLGMMCLVTACIILEVFLCYTGLIIYVLWLVDYSEPFNFAQGPIFYLLVYGLTFGNLKREQWLHFIPMALYGLYMVFFFVQSNDFKFNAYIDAYYPAIARLPVVVSINPDPLGIKAHINLLGISHVFIYIVLAFASTRHQWSESLMNPFAKLDGRMNWFRLFVLLHLASYCYWVYRTFAEVRDLQDHIAAALATFTIYFVGFKMMSDSSFFDPAKKESEEKYAKSTLSKDRKAHIINKLKAHFVTNKSYLDNDISLPGLAREIGTSTHHLSQAINEGMGVSFFELVSDCRIQEAKKMLREDSAGVLKIEEIAERVGYNSKSAFNNAFKKHTGSTPAAFRDRHS